MSIPDAVARELSRDALGLVTVADLVEAGVAHSTVRRKVARREWQRVSARVVDVTAQRWSWERRVLAAVLEAPRGAVASHATAAALHDLPGFRRRGQVELLVPRSGRNRELPFVVHSTTVPVLSPATIEDVPVTGLARTLHAVASSGDVGGLSRGVRASLRRSDVDADGLLDERLARLPGRALLARTVAEEAAALRRPVESPLEELWVDRLLDWRMPAFATQHPVSVEGRRYRLDVAWSRSRVALEGDGDGFHGDRRSQDRDGRRDERLDRAAWTLVRVGWADLRPDRAERVRRRLEAHLA